MTSTKLLATVLIATLVMGLGADQAFAKEDKDPLKSLKKDIQNLLSGLRNIVDILNDHEARITALEVETTPVEFGNSGTIAPISLSRGEMGYISFVSLDHPNCADNRVRINDQTQQFVQYDWCPEAQSQDFLIPTSGIPSTAAISITIANQPTDRIPMSCSAGGAQNMTVRDGDTLEEITVEGFLMHCDQSSTAGMTMHAMLFTP